MVPPKVPRSHHTPSPSDKPAEISRQLIAEEWTSREADLVGHPYLFLVFQLYFLPWGFYVLPQSASPAIVSVLLAVSCRRVVCVSECQAPLMLSDRMSTGG